MVLRTLLIVQCLTTCVPNGSTVESDQTLPAELDAVSTLGSWRAGEREGRHRIVIRSGGTEHVTSRLAVEWIELGSTRTGGRVVRSVQPSEIESGIWALAVDSVRPAPGGSEVFITGRRDEWCARWTLWLGPPGEIVLRHRALPSH